MERDEEVKREPRCDHIALGARTDCSAAPIGSPEQMAGLHQHTLNEP